MQRAAALVYRDPAGKLAGDAMFKLMGDHDDLTLSVELIDTNGFVTLLCELDVDAAGVQALADMLNRPI